jgi:hypothetical protein
MVLRALTVVLRVAPLALLLNSSGVAPASDVEPIVSPAAAGSVEPNFAVGDDGRVYMSWLEPLDSGYALRVAMLDGSRWSPSRTVRSGRDFFVNWADFPSIVSFGKGRIAAHWLQRSGKGTYAYHVKVSLSSDDGATWSAPITPHTDTSNSEHGFVALWPNRSGIGAAWLDGRGYDKTARRPTNEMMVLTTGIDPSGARGAERILDRRACDCCQTAAALTSTGPIVAYRDRSPDEIRDIYIVRQVSGRWSDPAPVHRDNWKINACPVNGPAVSASGKRVAVAWFTAASDSARVKLAFSSDNGASFRAPIRIDDGAPGGRVDVELLTDGSALVTWIERTGGDTAAVKVRRVRADGRAGPSVTVATSSAARASGFPRLAVSGDKAYYAWTVPGRPSQVRVARMALSAIR